MFIILAASESRLAMNFFSASLPVLGMWAHEEHLDEVSIEIKSRAVEIMNTHVLRDHSN